MENEAGTNKKTPSSKAIKIGVIVVIAVIAIYIVGAVFFHNRYLFGTKIGDKKYWGQDDSTGRSNVRRRQKKL